MLLYYKDFFLKYIYIDYKGDITAMKGKTNSSIAIIIFFIFSFAILIAGKNLRVNNWVGDIDYLVTNLNTIHPNPYDKVFREEFDNNILKLKENLHQMKNDQIKLRLQEVISTLGDAHTSLYIEKNNIFPLELKWFEDELIVVRISKKYKEVLGMKLTKINDVPIEEIESKVNKIISYENPQWLRARSPDHFNNAMVLKYFNIIKSNNSKFTFENNRKKTKEIIMRAEKLTDFNLISIEDIMPIKPITLQVPNGQSPYYWCRYIPENKILYVQYNTCFNKEMAKSYGFDNYDDYDFASFANTFINSIYDYGYTKLILDLRNNTGGNTGLLDSLIGSVIGKVSNENINFFVLTSKTTFSSAFLHAEGLRRNLGNVSIVGEEPGQNLNRYGDAKWIVLPNSKVHFSISSKKFTLTDSKNIRLIPDMPIEQSFDDYMKGIDSSYDYIKGL